MCVDVRNPYCQPSIHLQICWFERDVQILNGLSIYYFQSAKRILKISLDQAFWKVIPNYKVIPAKLLRNCRNTLSARIQSCRVRGINYKYSVVTSFLAAEKLNYCPRFSTSTGAKQEDFFLSEQVLELLEGNKWKLLRRFFSKLHINSGCNLLNSLCPFLIGLNFGERDIIRFNSLQVGLLQSSQLGSTSKLRLLIDNSQYWNKKYCLKIEFLVDRRNPRVIYGKLSLC